MDKKQEIKFIDLFAGIGGFRLGLESNITKCVFACEIDAHAATMYQANFGDDPSCDISNLDAKNIPNFDILCAGFPCQAFSISGKQKGFNDAIRGTLFFDIIRILREKKPKAFILENVANLLKHDKGNTFFIMQKTLTELGYTVSYKVLNAKDFGVAQNRARIVIVGNNQGKVFDFDKIKINPVSSMKEFLDKDSNEYLNQNEYTLLDQSQIKIQKSGLIFIGYRNKKIRNKGIDKETLHLSRVHKQVNRIYSSRGLVPTITSQEKSGRYFIHNNNKVRKLTLNECYKLMGFPDYFKKIGSTSKLYERIGNSVCVPMIRQIANEMIHQFWNNRENMDITTFLENIYKESLTLTSVDKTNLNNKQKHNIQIIVDHEEGYKGVFTVLVTSLVYKILHPHQDIRLHQANMKNGYSGRSFDAKYITPFLKQKQFLGAMKESGWTTRTLEQNFAYNLDYPGKISNIDIKNAFLSILYDVQELNIDPRLYLKSLFALSIKQKEIKSVNILNPFANKTQITIDDIINLLNQHFYYNYKSRGASILPVIALYSIYQCILKENYRYKDKILNPLSSHYSSDKSSKNVADIIIKNKDGSLFEAIEVKFNIKANDILLADSYIKFKNTSIQRFYLLSTVKQDEAERINQLINKIKLEHGCQVVVNGVLESIKYYLRLLHNTENFIENYINNMKENNEINSEHKIAWNHIINDFKNK
ncbi:DNA cytosine methyltransferase [Mycoplasma sp. 6243]|uniref:DNA cytosine methyltransferase n=1 Tax=Mycoplasma sp. 6243 TaxID=3440865 RepID=UPI003EB71513